MGGSSFSDVSTEYCFAGGDGSEEEVSPPPATPPPPAAAAAAAAAETGGGLGEPPFAEEKCLVTMQHNSDRDPSNL